MESRDDFSDSSLKLSIGSSTLAAFSVDVVVGALTGVYVVKIGYVSVDDLYDGVYCLWVEYATFV